MTRKVLITLILSITLIYSTALPIQAAEPFPFTTIEGTISSIQTETGRNLTLTVGKKMYTLSGLFIDELRRMSGIKVKVSGKITSPWVSNTVADIEIIVYSVIHKGYLLGKLHPSAEGLVFVSNDHLIYKVTNLADNVVYKLYDTKVLVKGEVQILGEYSATLTVEYCVQIDPITKWKKRRWFRL